MDMAMTRIRAKRRKKSTPNPQLEPCKKKHKYRPSPQPFPTSMPHSKSRTQSQSQQLVSTRSSRKKTRQAKTPQRNEPGNSHLERLPVELLEPILKDSLNFNLPLLSRTLYTKLQRHQTCSEICWAILNPEDNGDPALQSDLLRRRCFNAQVYKKTLLKLGVKLLTDNLDIPYSSTQDKLHIKFAPGTLMPTRAVRYPFLGHPNLPSLLFRGGVQVDWEGSLVGEAAQLGMKEAIAHGLPEAVESLCVIGTTVTSDNLIQALTIAKSHVRLKPSILSHRRFRLVEAILYAALKHWTYDQWRDYSLWGWAEAQKRDELQENGVWNIGFLFSGFLRYCIGSSPRPETEDLTRWFMEPRSIKTIERAFAQ